MPTLTTPALLERLQATRSTHPGPCVLATDGDGTLWEQDVAHHFIAWLFSRGPIRAEARDALAEFSAASGLPASADPVAAMVEAWQQGRMTPEMASQAGALVLTGRPPAAWKALAREALDALPGGLRLFSACAEVLAWARSQGIPVWVVSAGTWPIAAAAAERHGIPGHRVIAASLSPHEAPGPPRPVPVGPGKPALLHQATGGLPVLAAFGNDLPDRELLEASALPVAVRPSATLRAELPSVLRWDAGPCLHAKP